MTIVLIYFCFVFPTKKTSEIFKEEINMTLCKTIAQKEKKKKKTNLV